MKRQVFVLVFILALGAVAASSENAKVISLKDGWRMQPLDSKLLAQAKQPKDKFPLPKEDPKGRDEMSADELIDSFEEGQDGDGDDVAIVDSGVKATVWLPKLQSIPVGDGFLPQLPADAYRSQDPEKDPPRAFKSNYNVWMERDVFIPKDWKGKWVRLEGDIGFVDLAVFVNGRHVATAVSPDFAIDFTDFIRCGETNKFRIFATNQGYGTPGVAYRGRDELVSGAAQFFQEPRLVRHDTPILQDVWADTSWRRRDLTVRCEIVTRERRRVRLVSTISEDAGRDPHTGELRSGEVVKRLEKTVELSPGTNCVALAESWSDAHPWELTDPFLYNCETTMTDADGRVCESECPKFIFGFREVWREGKECMLNGHKQHYRSFWGAAPEKLEDIRKYGFNTVCADMQHQSRYWCDGRGANDGGDLAQRLEKCSRLGFACWDATPSASVCVRSLKGDRAQQEAFRRYLGRWARGVRNYPCLHGASVCMNTMCAAWWTMGAKDFGCSRTGTPESDDIYGGIGTACAMAKELHPNCLYYAHGDGNTYDVCTCNFYFNWTPLQEREEWLSSWSRYGENRGAIPSFACEFGAPYYGSWFPQPTHAQAMTELSAAYLGRRAYELEDEKLLDLSREFTYSSLGSYYGGWAKVDGVDRSLFEFSEAGRILHGLFIERVNRAWRVWGQVVRPIYLDAMDWAGGGTNGWELVYHKRYNGPCCIFIGGGGEAGGEKRYFTDKTHAYRAGEKVEKVFAGIWDGAGNNVFAAAWKVVETGTGKVVASGEAKHEAVPGESFFIPFSFKAPEVAVRTRYRIEAEFVARDIDSTTDRDVFEIEVHPAPKKVVVPSGKDVALFDPRGESAPVLEKLGIPFRRVQTLDALVASPCTHLVIGRRALDGHGDTNRLERLVAVVENGRRVMILAQMPATWQALGLTIEDIMPRQLWNDGLVGVDDADLAYWRGMPLRLKEGGDWKWGEHWGAVQDKTNGSRMWRWRHSHTLAMEVFMIPQRTIFRPLVIGEFDLMYSPLMRATFGKGALTVCSFDFEGGRFGDDPALACPAAQSVAYATFSDYLADRSVAETKVYADGAAAVRLAEVLGLDATPWDGGRIGDGVLIVGGDAACKPKAAVAALGANSHLFVVDAPDFAKGLGLKLETPMEDRIERIPHRKAYRDLKSVARPKTPAAEGGDMDDMLDEEIDLEEQPEDMPAGMTSDKIPIEYWEVKTNRVQKPYLNTRDTANFGRFPFRGVGPQHLRWRSPMTVRRIAPAKGWTVAGDGVFAVSDDGKVLVDMLKPFQLTDECKKGNDKGGLGNAVLSQNQQLRRYSLVLANWGVKPGAALLRRVLTLPAPVAEGAKPPAFADLYFSECAYDTYWFTLW